MTTTAAASPSNAFRLDGRVALVTGAAQGLGAGITEALAIAGARVLATDINEAGVQALAETLRGRGLVVQAAAQDVCDEGRWDQVMTQAVQALGGLDVLVNNAGIEILCPLADMSLADFRRVQQINVEGVFLGVRAAMRCMRPGGTAGRGGSIVNLSSGAGLRGSFLLGAYSASKGAVRLLSKSAALECARMGYGIRVNSVHPAVVDTPMGQRTLEGIASRLGLPAFDEQSLKTLQPLGMGQPSDIGNAVLYLASDAARWVTGTELVVDGGFNA